GLSHGVEGRLHQVRRDALALEDLEVRMAGRSAEREADEVAVDDQQVQLRGRGRRRVVAGEPGLDLAVVRATVAVAGVAVVARLRGQLDGVAAPRDAGAGAAVGLEGAGG